MNTLCWAMLMAILLFQAPSCGTGGRTQPEVPRGGGDGTRHCCNTSTEFGPIQIAGNTDQVPPTLQGCGSHSEKITAIVIRGRVTGCAEESSNMTFSNLHIDFTTDGTECQGGRAGALTSSVDLTNVVYSGHLRLPVTPPCVADSSVTGFQIENIPDSGFHTLFLTNGGETLRPILDNLVLRWNSSPPGSCPPSQGFGTAPVIVRCP